MALWALQASSPYYVMPYVVWNFPNTKAIHMANAGFRGSILAPDAGAWPELPPTPPVVYRCPHGSVPS